MPDFLKPPTLTEQLKVLAECGIALKPGVDSSQLLARFPESAFEKRPYLLLLIAMGGEPEWGSPYQDAGYASDGIWHFDTECIEDNGSYVRIANRMSELAQGGLPLEDVRDFVDIGEGEARLSFTLDGKAYAWNAAVMDDWLDPGILSQFAKLLEARGTGRRFIHIDLGGQDCLIGCVTETGKTELAARTGLPVQWLD